MIPQNGSLLVIEFILPPLVSPADPQLALFSRRTEVRMWIDPKIANCCFRRLPNREHTHCVVKVSKFPVVGA